MIKTYNKVAWVEGIFLGQQHFQQWDHYLEAQARFRQLSSVPLSWGICSLTIDESALLNGVFRVLQCQLIFANGQCVSYQSNNSETLSCELKGEESSAIYLALPLNEQLHGITGYPEQVTNAAWQADYQEIVDDYDSSRSREVLFAKEQLFVLQDDESRTGVIKLKIAEVVRSRDGRYQLNQDFIPAIVCLKASERLKHILASLVDRIRSTIRILNTRLSQSKSQDELSMLGMLQILSMYLPKLQFQTQQLNQHPVEMYKAICELIGGLWVFTKEQEIPDYPVYQHDGLSSVFCALERDFNRYLIKAMPKESHDLKLIRKNNNLYYVESIDNHVLKHASFYLLVSFGKNNVSWIPQFIKQTKITSQGHIHSVIASALPGLRLTHSQRLPHNISIRPGFEYFYLESKGEDWLEIIAEKNMAIFMPDSFADATIELISYQEVNQL